MEYAVLLSIILASGIGSYVAAGVFRYSLMRIATYDPLDLTECTIALWDELPFNARAAHLIAKTTVILTWPFWRLALLLPQQENHRDDKTD
jgi:hypothetical protein